MYDGDYTRCEKKGGKILEALCLRIGAVSELTCTPDSGPGPCSEGAQSMLINACIPGT